MIEFVDSAEKDFEMSCIFTLSQSSPLEKKQNKTKNLNYLYLGMIALIAEKRLEDLLQ